MKVIVTIAGSDPTAGAGLQADIKTIAACGGYGASVCTAVTVQTGRGVSRCERLAPDLVGEQLRRLVDDVHPAAIKTGMLGDAAIVNVVADALKGWPGPLVVDPVGRASSGATLLDDAGLSALRQRLLPGAALVTPNTMEAAALTGDRVDDLASAEVAGRRLLETGVGAALITGGHFAAARGTDVLVSHAGVEHVTGPVINADAPHSHGTGCALSAAVATLLGRGATLADAVRRAKRFVAAALGAPPGIERGAMDHLFALPRSARPLGSGVGRLHVITDETVQSRFDHVGLAREFAAGGADVVQLREKRIVSTAERVAVAARAREALAGSPAVLLVDDRADVAAAAGVAAVHLGRDDLDAATARRLLGDDALIGGTANDLQQAQWVAQTPVDYLGVGPVFATRSKANPAETLGVDGLRAIVDAIDKPVIAIGGITAERVAPVIVAGGAFGVAALSTVVTAAEPRAETARLRAAVDRAIEQPR